MSWTRSTHAAAVGQLSDDTFFVFEAASSNFITKSRQATHILPYNITVADSSGAHSSFLSSLAPMQVP